MAKVLRYAVLNKNTGKYENKEAKVKNLTEAKAKAKEIFNDSSEVMENGFTYGDKKESKRFRAEVIAKKPSKKKAEESSEEEE